MSSGDDRSRSGQSRARPYRLVAVKTRRDRGVPVSHVERSKPAPVPHEALDKMRAALEAAGVVFIPKDGGGGIGVRLREALEGEYIGWNDLNASNDE